MKGFSIIDGKRWHMASLASSGAALKSARGVGVGRRQIGSFFCSTSQLRAGRENGGEFLWSGEVPGRDHSS